MSGKTIALVQARMSSSRFPGKVLTPLAGKPMVIQQLERLARATHIDQIVVATSSDASDDPLVETLHSFGYSTFRGSLTDVLSRFTGAAREHQADVVVRITADCPLLSPTVVDRVIEEFQAAGVDYASNTLDPTYPDGLDVEVVRVAALEALAAMELDADEREHVTLGIYRRPETFTVHSVTDPAANQSDLRWTVDTPEDLDFVAWVYESLENIQPAFDYPDVIELVAKYPQRSRTSVDGVRNAALVGKDTGVMKGPTS